MHVKHSEKNEQNIMLNNVFLPKTQQNYMPIKNVDLTHFMSYK